MAEDAFDSLRSLEHAERDVIATWARYDQPLGSVSKGTVRRVGATEVAVDLPDDPTGQGGDRGQRIQRDRDPTVSWMPPSLKA